MTRCWAGSGVQLVDPTCVPDTFVEGIAEVEEHAEFVRLTLYSSRRNSDGGIEHIVVARLVYPKSVAVAINQQCRAFLAGEKPLNADVPQGVLAN
jgi:hypothetical protein